MKSIYKKEIIGGVNDIPLVIKVDRWRYSPEIIKNYQSTIQIGVLVGD